MKYVAMALSGVVLFVLTACATPPSADPSLVEVACGQQCSVNLTNCSSGFKLFPVVQQKQCNDTYDVCIKGCPTRTLLTPRQSTAERLKVLDDLFQSGAISKEEYGAKRKQVMDSL